MNPEAVGTEEGLEYWREREMLVTELTDSAGWQALLELAHSEIEAKKLRLLGGSVDTHEGYLRLVHEIRGAEFVLSLPGKVSEITASYRRLLAEASGAE